MIPLDGFEKTIDKRIIKRGLTYFKYGYVTGFVELSDGEYEAIVSGTENEYTVKLKVRNNAVVEHSCTCPYDYGPVCKHVVATIYYLKQHELEQSKRDSSRAKKKKRKTVAQQMDEILNTVPYNELREFIKKQGKTDKRFRQLFLSYFAYLNKEPSKAFYQNQIESAIDILLDMNGFINWDEINYFEREVQMMSEVAQKSLERGNYVNTFYIGSVLLEHLVELPLHLDEDEIIDSLIEKACDIINDLSEANLPEELRKKVFKYCITLVKDDFFGPGLYNLILLDSAYNLSRNAKEADVLIECLDSEYASTGDPEILEIKKKALKKHKVKSKG